MGPCGEGTASIYQAAKFRNSDALGGVAFEYPPEYEVELVCKGENCLEERRIPQESIESRVVQCGLLPGVTTTGKVDQDNTERPNVIRTRSVT